MEYTKLEQEIDPQSHQQFADTTDQLNPSQPINSFVRRDIFNGSDVNPLEEVKCAPSSNTNSHPDDYSDPLITEINNRQHNNSGNINSQNNQQNQQQPRPQKEQAHSKFECNICLDLANEPVVSTCGHLYCWECIYQWINQPKETLLCPVCKSGISKETLIPIYTKGNTEDPRKKSSQEIPKRPAGQRQGPVPNQNFNQGGGLFGNNNSGSGFVMGLGIFPALFTLNFTWEDIFGPNGANNRNGAAGGGANAANNEESREQQLQRLLLIFMFFMFMSFVFFGGDVFLTF
eukprot:403368086